MGSAPLISIVTPSYNQGRYLVEALQSLVDQDYPNLEVIIQDGGSTDGAIAVAEDFVRRFPGTFELFVEKDDGQADALNHGFARAKGEILGFLNSDDTLKPGCLHSVAREIDPRRGRWIVMGRCLFTGESSAYVGVEHPAEYKSHFELLAIWKRGYNTIPQPSVFWHRHVWTKRGGFDVNEHYALDYDLFCRFSRGFHFYRVDELWSTYRMHPVSKTAQRTEAEVLGLSIQVSRRYWGRWWSPLRWRCEISHWIHNKHLHEYARHHARRAEEAAEAGRRFVALREFIQTLAYSPVMARDRLFRAWLANYHLRFVERLLRAPDEGFTGHYGDMWIGPIYRTDVEVPEQGRRLVLQLKHIPQGSHIKATCVLRLNRAMAARHTATVEESFAIEADLTPFRGRRCQLELRSDSFFVPRQVHDTPDDRRLSLQLLATTIEEAQLPIPNQNHAANL